jgi:hypothetical protein
VITGRNSGPARNIHRDHQPLKLASAKDAIFRARIHYETESVLQIFRAPGLSQPFNCDLVLDLFSIIRTHLLRAFARFFEQRFIVNRFQL